MSLMQLGLFATAQPLVALRVQGVLKRLNATPLSRTALLTAYVAFRLTENRWNGTVAPQLVIRHILEGDDRYPALRAQLAAEWEAGETGWSSEGRAIFEELVLDGSRVVSLYESETFRALLEQEPALLQQAA